MLKMVSRLARRIPLTDAETRFLDSIAKRPIPVRRGQLIHIAGDRAVNAFFLESGWAMTFSDFSDGSRQSRRLHFPGDLLGLPSIATKHNPASIEAITDVVIAPFDKAMMAELMASFPRLATIMFIFAQEERITLGDRLCSLSMLHCQRRLAFLLMDVLTRVRASDPGVQSTFEMHLTRAQMAEITGMTPVHASRMWGELLADGVIAWDRPFLTVIDEERLSAVGNFINRSADLDFSWLPGSAG